TFSGDGTYYNPSVGTGSCGTLNSDSELVAAINAPQYGTDANPNNAAVCGKCILVKGPNGQVKVTVVDKCPPCKQGDLDLSPAAFEQIAEFDQGRVPITWQFVSC
ncbi:RlpA-like double-psi beta-barrel-protein domain-containing protein-containing protein, partial [Kickxella alabastrina]|uniref:RlpA-like double-psi beta-barrel-protein domain-containing protein-containing protein n=1 Tax=Kickxella alabastrina TaxID=61397 RepID=UPI002220D51F